MPKAPRATGNNAGGNQCGVHADPPGGRPQLADAYSRGRGVHNDNHLSEQRPQLDGSADGKLSNGGVHGTPPQGGTCEQRRAWLVDWFRRLRDRLRTVRVCCGSWLRVCDSESVTTRLGTTGLFLDPPYCMSLERLAAWKKHLRGEGPEPPVKRGGKNRAEGLYATDGADVDRLVAEVHLYCVERGPDPNMRIVLCGYAGEHDELEALGWEVVAWKSQGGYANRNKANKNSGRERLFCSPHCCRTERQSGLFDTLTED